MRTSTCWFIPHIPRGKDTHLYQYLSPYLLLSQRVYQEEAGTGSRLGPESRYCDMGWTHPRWQLNRYSKCLPTPAILLISITTFAFLCFIPFFSQFSLQNPVGELREEVRNNNNNLITWNGNVKNTETNGRNKIFFLRNLQIYLLKALMCSRTKIIKNPFAFIISP